MIKTARLVLEDGTIFEGEHFGAAGTVPGEAVFSTAMFGYQQVLTDPSFFGQLVVMTYPLIGNYGIGSMDRELPGIGAQGLIVREFCGRPSHWQANFSLDEFCKSRNIVGLSGVDTRAIARHLREFGTMRAVLTTEDLPVDRLLELARQWTNRGLVSKVSTDEVKALQGAEEGAGAHVAVLDLGVSQDLLQLLIRLGCRVTVFPADRSADEILDGRPDGVLISNGPGSPDELNGQISQILKLSERLPIFGYGLGHQLLGMAYGTASYKLKSGHRGESHPVKNLLTGRVMITRQHHGYALDPDTLPGEQFEVTHIHLGDRSIEGIRHRHLPIYSVQFDPGSCPATGDFHPILGEFLIRMNHPKTGEED